MKKAKIILGALIPHTRRGEIYSIKKGICKV
jgi:hypothetical protein